MANSTVLEKKNIVQLIIFQISDEEFAIPIEAVQEIIKATTITPIPHSPGFIKGLLSVRGDIVATIDLRARFLFSPDATESKHIIIAKQENNLFGLLVDEVIEVLRIQELKIKNPPQIMTKIQQDLVKGIITHEDRLIILLDIKKVLSEEELNKLTVLAKKEKPTGKKKLNENCAFTINFYSK